VTKIKVLPMEVRRPSFMMASGHTFRYLGYGSGNYSTAVPQKQTRVLTDDDILKSQAKEMSGGTIVYDGLNDRGDSFDGAKKYSSITGQETVVEAPIITFTGDDVDSDSASKLDGTFDTILVRDKLTVEGGPEGTETSVFYGPVKVDDVASVNRLQFNSVDGSGSVSIVSPSNLELDINAGVSIRAELAVGAGVTVISSITANSFVKRGEDGTKYLRADGIASSITSGNITSALGYVPQNSASAIATTGDYPKGNSLIVDTLTPAFDGVTSTYILRINGVEYDVPGNSGGANLIVSLGDVIQKAGTDYVLLSNPSSGLQKSRISFTSAPAVGTECFILALGGQGALLTDPSWTTKGQIPVALSGNNAQMLNVGTNGLVLTADSNSGFGVTWGQVTSVGIATNLKGGSTGAIPYQSSANNTTFVNVGAAGSILSSDGTNPIWRPLTGATATWGSLSNSVTSLIDFTNIPTWAREITVMFDFLGFYVGSSGGNSHLRIALQPGNSTIFSQNLGRSNSFFITGGGGSGQVITNGGNSIGCFIGASTNAISGQVTFKKFDNFVAGQYIWYATGSWTYVQNGPNPSDTASGWVSGSIFSPPGAGTGWQPVTRVRLFSSNDLDLFGGNDRDTRIQVSYQ